ncbi:hypothetical protein Tco_0574773, partial [Tanacetum coccineum]
TAHQGSQGLLQMRAAGIRLDETGPAIGHVECTPDQWNPMKHGRE